MSNTVLVLHSGGLDSTVCLKMALAAGHKVVSLGIDYGQRHLIEHHYASTQCAALNVDRFVAKVNWEKPHRELPLGRTPKQMQGNISTAFLPGRNGIFLMLGCAQAAGILADEVWTGVNSVDFSGYPDCRPEFISAFNGMIDLAIPGGPKVVAPLQNMSKPEIARLANDLGLKKGDTWSCYRPQIHASGVAPCGRCDACVLHEHAWSFGGHTE